MRLFISINPPSELQQYFKELQAEIGLNKAGLNFAKDFHLTLKFLGETGDNEISEIKSLLKTIKFKQFKANLKDVGIFPNEKLIRVIWAGAEPEEKFKELFLQIDKQMSKFAKNEHDFKAHITLARVKFVNDKQALIDSLKKIKIEKKEFAVDAFYLMKSTLTPEGPVYEVVERFELE